MRKRCRPHGVTEQHRDRHRANTTWYWRDRRSHLRCLRKINVTAKLAVSEPIDANVNHYRAGLDPIAANKICLANCRHQNVSAPAVLGETLRA
jgi:hypothetical protein